MVVAPFYPGFYLLFHTFTNLWPQRLACILPYTVESLCVEYVRKCPGTRAGCIFQIVEPFANVALKAWTLVCLFAHPTIIVASVCDTSERQTAREDGLHVFRAISALEGHLGSSGVGLWQIQLHTDNINTNKKHNYKHNIPIQTQMENTNANGKYECKIGGSSQVIWGRPVASIALFITLEAFLPSFKLRLIFWCSCIKYKQEIQIQTKTENTLLKDFFRGWWGREKMRLLVLVSTFPIKRNMYLSWTEINLTYRVSRQKAHN